MTVSIIDINATDALTIDAAAPDARSMMLASAASLVSTVIEVEGKLADTAKAWGANVFTLAYPADDTKPLTLDALIGDSKMAAGWPSLATTDAGKKAKSRMEVYFSNARLVAETFDALSDDDKRDIRAGVSSIHYRAGLIRKAAADAKKAAAKEAARIAAEEAAAAAKLEAEATKLDASNPAPEADATPPATSLADMLAALMLAIDAASDDELSGVYDDFAAVTASFDDRINAAMEAAPVAVNA
jgi:hypothetical protein